MIKVVLKDRRSIAPFTYPPLPWKAPTGAPQPVSNIAVFKETARRENIIKKLVSECGFTEGQVVLSDVKEEEEYVINKICRCYAHLGSNVDWPVNDNPMLLTITSVKNTSVSFCTTNYVKAKP